jgi:hypothetical protein
VQALAELVFCKRGRSLIWIQPELGEDSVIDRIATPDELLGQPECAIIKDQPKIKVGCLQVALGDRQLRLYIKRYNVFSWRNRLGSLFSASGAVKSIRGAAILTAAGIGTARPVASVEQRRWGMLTSSFYLTEEVPGGKVSIQYWREELRPMAGAAGIVRRRAFVRDLAEVFATLHAKNIYHNDLKDFNILVVPKGDTSGDCFFLLDLEGVRCLRQLSHRRRIKNLVQLNRTLGKLLSRVEALRFLKSYLGTKWPNRVETKKWARSIVKQSRELDRQKQVF